MFTLERFWLFHCLMVATIVFVNHFQRVDAGTASSGGGKFPYCHMFKLCLYSFLMHFKYDPVKCHQVTSLIKIIFFFLDSNCADFAQNVIMLTACVDTYDWPTWSLHRGSSHGAEGETKDRLSAKGTNTWRGETTANFTSTGNTVSRMNSVLLYIHNQCVKLYTTFRTSHSKNKLWMRTQGCSFL